MAKAKTDSTPERAAILLLEDASISVGNILRGASMLEDLACDLDEAGGGALSGRLFFFYRAFNLIALEARQQIEKANSLLAKAHPLSPLPLGVIRQKGGRS